MVRLDIIAGIKNAVERGYSIDQAKKSLINAGYSIEDINEAVNYVTGGVMIKEIIPQIQTQEYQTYENLGNAQIQSQTPRQNTQNIFQGTSYGKAAEKQQKEKFPWKITILTLFLFILITILILTIFLRESIISFLSSFLG